MADVDNRKTQLRESMAQLSEEMIEAMMLRIDAVWDQRFEVELSNEKLLTALGPDGVDRAWSHFQSKKPVTRRRRRKLRKELSRKAHWPHRYRHVFKSEWPEPGKLLPVIDFDAWASLDSWLRDQSLKPRFKYTSTWLAGLSALGEMRRNPAVDDPEVDRLSEEYADLYEQLQKATAEERALRKERLATQREAAQSEEANRSRERLEAAREALASRKKP